VRFHLYGNAQNYRDRAQGAEDPADAMGVPDGLAQTVPARDVEVNQCRLVTADLDHIDHVISSI
jgi:hypothetical protein